MPTSSVDDLVEQLKSPGTHAKIIPRYKKLRQQCVKTYEEHLSVSQMCKSYTLLEKFLISRALHWCRFWALLLITYFWVNYKLFRLNTYIDLPWNLHVYIALPFVLTGLIIHLSLITKFSTIMKTRGAIALIFWLLWFVLLYLVIFNNGDCIYWQRSISSYFAPLLFFTD